MLMVRGSWFLRIAAVLVLMCPGVCRAGEPGQEAVAAAPARERILDLGEGVKLELVLVPPGHFEMGADEWKSDGRPAHPV
jgi:hypothetical protein